MSGPLLSFRRAERRKAWMKIALTGPSGSGKTYSALLIASGMGKRIAVVDTENGSASLYAGQHGMPEFDVLEIDPPYTIQKYTSAIQTAVDLKYEVLIIDSLSHAWAGEGGLLQQKEDLDARGGRGEKNKFANWGAMTKQHEQFKGWLLKADIHLVVTMRSKQDYVLGEGNAPIKVGMAPIQRDGMEYEFTTVFDLAMNHQAKTSKDRTGLFDGKMFVPDQKTGESVMAWLNGGSGELHREASVSAKGLVEKAPQGEPNNNRDSENNVPAEPPFAFDALTEDQRTGLIRRATKLKLTDEDADALLKPYAVTRIEQLDKHQASHLIKELDARLSK